ncbi:MAG: phosphomannose isomerase type II C-terminal cupin domain [Patescibacteria group bacterium]
MNPIIDTRPWGEFKRFTHNEPTTVKIITVNAGEELSLQFHKHRREFLKILSGTGTMQIGDKKIPAEKGAEFFVEVGQHHRVSAGDEPLEFLEIAFGDFDENDIVRLEDKYGRKGSPPSHEKTRLIFPA